MLSTRPSSSCTRAWNSAGVSGKSPLSDVASPSVS